MAMKSHDGVSGRVVAVTGAGRGIGRAIAETLARPGAAVAVGDRDLGTARETAEAIRRRGGRAVALTLDVADEDSFARFLEAAERVLGPIDVLVNNAGIMWVGPFPEEPDTTARRQFDVNVHGVMIGTRLIATRMRARGATGHIVTIASAASKLAPQGEATYAATKHAVYGYLTAVRAELRGSGVEVSVVMPTVVDTPLAAGTSAGVMRRLTAQDVAVAVLGVIEHPRPEVYVPRRAGLFAAATAVLPARARFALYRLVLPDQAAAVATSTLQAGDEPHGQARTAATESNHVRGASR